MKPIETLIKWYFSRTALPYWSVLFMDCLIILLSGMSVYALQNGTVFTLGIFYPLLGTYCVYLLCYLIGFRIFHTYSGILRFSSFIDLRRVALAMGIGMILVVLLQWIFHLDRWLIYLSFDDVFFTTLVAIAIMWAVRIWVKSLYDNVFIRSNTRKRVFIYGIKEGGVAIAKSINTQPNAPFKVAGFVSDYGELAYRMLMGVKVYPNNESLASVMATQGATILLVSPLKSDEIRNNSEMINSLMSAGIKIYMMPDAQEWDASHDVSYANLREVDLEDLLPRDKIEIDMEAVGNLLRGQTILITGAAGSIGSEMVRQIARFEPGQLILIDQAETPLHDIRLMMAKNWPDINAATIIADIANEKRMEDIFKTYRPNYVFHAAAYKHVPMMEDNPHESIENNVNGTRIVADLAVKYGTIKFVMISTDKAVNPTNVMGCSKRICEIYVQSLDKAIKDGKIEGVTQFVTTRFGNVLGSNGSVVPLFREQIRNGGPVTVTHPDIIRFFMLIPEACKLVLEAGTMGKGGEIFVFDMGEPVRIADLAQRMINISGAKNVEIKYTGLRDGEKLYEEMLNDKEVTLPTFHPKIKIARVREYDYSDVKTRISILIQTTITSDDMAIVKLMKELVPEFKSQHSKYQVLDKKD